eukprot:3205196-Amphidinium_carterae.1
MQEAFPELRESILIAQCLKKRGAPFGPGPECSSEVLQSIFDEHVGRVLCVHAQVSSSRTTTRFGLQAEHRSEQPQEQEESFEPVACTWTAFQRFSSLLANQAKSELNRKVVKLYGVDCKVSAGIHRGPIRSRRLGGAQHQPCDCQPCEDQCPTPIQHATTQLNKVILSPDAYLSQ